MSNNATANTPLFKETTAPVIAIHSENDGKCIATYLSNATGDECITPPFSAVEAFLTFTDFANAAAAANRLFLLLCIRHASKPLLKIKPIRFAPKMIWQ